MQIKAWRIHEYGGSDVLQLDTVELAEPGPGEVRIKVLAGGMNRSDLLWTTAAFFKPELPAKVGAEVCGVIEQLGESVVGFKVGDRVSSLPLYTRGAASAYSHFGERINLGADELVHTPAKLSDAEGAAFLYTHLTQACGLVEVAQLKPGQTLLVTAGSSANGMSAILLGRKLGARVIATTRGADKRELLLRTGAHEVVVTTQESLPQRVAQITEGRGADVIYDCVGGALSNDLLASVATNGRWVMFGFLDPSPVTVSWPMWFMRQPSLHIYSLTQFIGSDDLGLPARPAEFARAVRTVLSLCGSGELGVPIARCFEGIESVKDAFAAVESNAGGGKFVVRF